MSLPGKFLTAQGLQIKTVEQILAELSADQRGENGLHPLLNTDPDSPMGQLNGTFASQLREAWEVLGILFGSLDPGEAEGALLDQVSAITGTKRNPATRSRFVGTHRLTVGLDAAASCPTGTIFAVDGDPTVRFVATETVTATLAGPYRVAAECEATGPVHCNAGTLTVIATPVVGLQSVTNDYDAELGAAEDLDPALRVRRESELRATGAANPDALRSDLLALEVDGLKPIQSCKVFANDGDVYDVHGLPPHSLECLIYDGLAAATPAETIAQVIWDGKPGGIRMIGNQSGIAVDDTGAHQVVPFSRPAIRDLDIKITLSADADYYAGDDAVKAALVAAFMSRFVSKPGQAVVCSAFVAAAVAVPGVTDVQGVQITFHGLAFPVTGVNLILGDREVGNTQANWVTVVQV